MVIYKIENTVDHKVYIGQASGPSQPRKWVVYRSQLKTGTHPNQHLQAGWDTFGADAFIFEIIDRAESKDQLDDLERQWIAKYGSTSRENGYNIEAGGNRHKKLAKETCEKLSRVKKGCKVSEITRKKMSRSRQGEKHPQYGKDVPEERRQRIALKLKEYFKSNPASDEYRNKLSASATAAWAKRKAKKEQVAAV